MHGLVRIGLIISCAFFIHTLFAQNQHKADSLLSVLSNQELDTAERLSALFQLATYSSSPNDELLYATQLLSLAQANNNQEYIIKANQRIGVAHRLLGNLGEAFEHLFMGANEAVSNPEFELILADIYTEISACYTLNRDSENALRYGQRTIEILRRSDRKQELAINLLNLGYDYYLIGEYDKALSYNNEAEEIFEELDMDIGLAYILGNRALVYWKQGQIEKAKADLITAISLLEDLSDYYGTADYYNQIGNIYLEENDLEKAEKNAMTGLEIAKANGLKEQIRDAYFILYRLSNNTENYKQGIEYQTNYHAYKDSIQNQETADLLANLRTEFEIERKQAEVNLLLEQRRNNQIIIFTGSIILVAVILIAILIYRYSKQKTTLNKQLNEQKNDLISLNDTKDKFFSIISHDLRGPVNVLNGLAFVIKKDIDKLEKEEVVDLLDQMSHSGKQLAKLLDNLLHWALHQRGQLPNQPEELEITSLLTEVCDIFKDMSISKEIAINLHADQEVNIYADRNATSTIFRNLLNNAIKFTESGGKVDVEVSMLPNNGYAGIKVSDTGVGIPTDKVKTLFEMRNSTPTEGTSGETGLGLGLQLVYDFVKINNGKIEVESEEGKGTSFLVMLPLA